jgi:hypothetical protein
MRFLLAHSHVLFVFAWLCLASFATTAGATLVVFPDGGWTAGSPAPGQTLNQNFTSGGQNITVSINNNGSSASGASSGSTANSGSGANSGSTATSPTSPARDSYLHHVTRHIAAEKLPDVIQGLSTEGVRRQGRCSCPPVSRR